VNRQDAQSEPPYIRIVTEIRQRITSGELSAGDRVPSTRQISRDWGVAIATATKVLTALRQEGLVRAMPGVGTVVATAEPIAAHPRAPRRREARDAEPELTQERIVRGAIELADADGLAALTMRGVAARLGVATMTLYRYVPGKDELILLMIDAAFGEEELPALAPSGWRAQLELVSRRQWAISRRHPWLGRVISLTRPQLAPHAMAHTEWALRAMDGLDLDPATKLGVVIAIVGYVQGRAVNLESEVEAQKDTGLTSDEWLESQESTFAQILASGRFPVLSGITMHPDFEFDPDTLFELGLTLMLDGLAVLLQRSPAS
jgi:AcrR family transcriptional regulator